MSDTTILQAAVALLRGEPVDDYTRDLVKLAYAGDPDYHLQVVAEANRLATLAKKRAYMRDYRQTIGRRQNADYMRTYRSDPLVKARRMSAAGPERIERWRRRYENASMNSAVTLKQLAAIQRRLMEAEALYNHALAYIEAHDTVKGR